MKYQYKLILHSLLLIVFCLGIVSQLIIPGLCQLVKLQSQLGVSQRRLDGLNSKLNDLRTTDNQEIAGMADRLLLAIPPTNHYLSLLGMVRSIINSNGIAIVNIQLNPGAIDMSETDSKPTKKLVVAVEIKGSFEAIQNMVNQIENGLPIIRVSSLSFDNKISSSSASLTAVKANMELVSYWSGLPSGLGKVDLPLEKLTPKDYAVVSLFDKYTITMVSEPVAVDSDNSNLPVGRENPFPI